MAGCEHVSVEIPESRSHSPDRNGSCHFQQLLFVLRLSSLPRVIAKPDHRPPDCRRKTKRERAPILSLPVPTVFVLLHFHLLFSTLGKSQPAQPPPSCTPFLSFSFIVFLSVLTIFISIRPVHPVRRRRVHSLSFFRDLRHPLYYTNPDTACSTVSRVYSHRVLFRFLCFSTSPTTSPLWNR